jgi:hypothetical protein
MPRAELPVEHLLTIRFVTKSRTSLGHHVGTRISVNVTGGEFNGPRLHGRVVSGADWVVRRPDGTLSLDVRAELLTDDGVTVFMTYKGLSTRDDSGTNSVRTVPRFDAPADSAHAWLNDQVCVGVGEVGDGSVVYEVYGLR